MVMRLPDRIEHEIRALEAGIAAETHQHAGTPRLRGLRYAVEEFMREARVDWQGHVKVEYEK